MTKPKATQDDVLHERREIESKQKADRQLAKTISKYERKITDLQIESAIAYRDRSFKYERQITNAQFETLKSMSEEHRIFHEREHILYDDAVDKASASILAQLATLQAEMERLEQASLNYMTTGRFEREHQALIERVDTKFGTYDEKIATEEKVTIRQDTSQAMLDRLATNNRWMIGILVTVILFGITTVLHLFKVI